MLAAPQAFFPVRAPHFRFIATGDASKNPIPRAWADGSIYRTQRFNAFHMIFPDGEVFFIRSVQAFVPQIKDPQLLANVRAFVGQEGRHGREHSRFLDVLRTHGYEVDSWVSQFRRRLEWGLGFFPASWSLAGTAAGEHFTAEFARIALDGRMDQHHPDLRGLFEWHSIEELEHKAVAFDVMRQVGIGYGTRMMGLALASYTIVVAWYRAAAHLRRQDKLSRAELKRGRKEVRERKDLGLRHMLGAALRYARPGFHPNDEDDSALLATARNSLVLEPA